MADPTHIPIPGVTSTDVFVHEWRLTSADPTGTPLLLPRLADRTVEFVGVSWGGATVVIEGSLWPDANYLALTNQNGVAISATGDDLSVITEATVSVRPRLSVVGSGAEVIVRVLIRK